MEAMQGMNRGFSVLVFLVALASKEALAKNHVVGGSQGWDVSTDFSSWASSNTFRVGDQIDFKYTPGLHSVVELSNEKDYNKCDIGNALDSMNNGASTVKLSKPGNRYFACGTPGHCEEGMKVKIKTLGTNEAASQDSASSSSTSPSSYISFVIMVVSLLLGFLYNIELFA